MIYFGGVLCKFVFVLVNYNVKNSNSVVKVR